MRLNELIAETADMQQANATAARTDLLEVSGLTADSRKVQPGWLFAAVPGERVDGRDFIDNAVARGAVAILAASGTALKPYGRSVALVTDENPRRRLALMAARFYGRQPRTIAAITGTNGKTSTASFTRQLWTLLGHPAASLGTLGLAGSDWSVPGALTTPDPVDLHRDLAELAARGIDHLALEASSHGLAQHRLDGVRITAAAFTGLTHEHLDYHGTMAAYGAAKRRLFEELLPAEGTAVLNADSDAVADFANVCSRRRQRVFRYGRSGAELRLESLVEGADEQQLGISVFGKPHRVRFPVPGRFQAENALCALGLVLATGAEPDAAVAALARLTGVHGRLERVARHPNGAPIYVDYAHKPDALEYVLKALRPYAAGRLFLVFGCGGDRDRAKRPMMGAIAERWADVAIVTDDNPRSEDPAKIRAAILETCPKGIEIGDRAKAIETAIAELGSEDLLVIAGKGHETGQTVGGVTHPFDDTEVARRVVASLPSRPAA